MGGVFCVIACLVYRAIESRRAVRVCSIELCRHKALVLSNVIVHLTTGSTLEELGMVYIMK